MTNSQKERINYMRQDGESYAVIADVLELSGNTVKSFCLRSTHADPHEVKAAPDKGGVCAQCGKGFMLMPRASTATLL